MSSQAFILRWRQWEESLEERGKEREGGWAVGGGGGKPPVVACVSFPPPTGQ